MTTARSIMHEGVSWVGPYDTLQAAAVLMRDRGVGALAVCDESGHTIGVITDRDIVVTAVAAGWENSVTTVSKLDYGPVYTVDADTDIDKALSVMQEHRIQRLSVTDDDMLVGIISVADIARRLPPNTVARFVETIYSAK